jgi:hypothetical protein
MIRKEIDADQMPGQDSFLDVVTNIVGILILLVLVVGLRSSRAGAAAVENKSVATMEQSDAVRDAYRAASETEHDVREVLRRTVDSRHDARLREQERQWLMETVAEAEAAIKERREKLNTEDQRDFDLRRQQTEAQLKLDELAREQVALLGKEEVEEIHCGPTPIARLVRGTEIRVRLADDHVSILPYEELMKLLEEDVKANIWRMKQEPEMTRSVGPVDGYRLTYRFVKKDYVSSSSRGVVSGTKIEFQAAYFVPVDEQFGEPAGDALADGSDFRRKLQQYDPLRTTITFWTYPGNYDRYRELKEAVRALGYQVAVRPLPTGMPIGFSPDGSRTAITD